MTSFEALAVTAFRRWCADRAAIRSGQTMQYKQRGWTPRSQCQTDARIVRALSFEQAFETLPDHEQSALLLAYRDGLSTPALCSVLRCRLPVAQAALASGRLRLANALDRRDLL